MSTPTQCADLSALAGESLGGTASTTQNWLLVEVSGTWPRDVSDGEGLSEAARRSARAWLERTPSSRLLFIRRPGRARGGGGLAFVVHADETSTSVRRLAVTDLEDIGDLDQAGADSTAAPLVLVCGHGTRDACCALRGTAVYGALAARLDPELVWISSHQGGHRFAANVLVLPFGLQFGRVSPADAHDVVARALAGRIDLDRFRGRTTYPPAVQAAEIAVRRAHGLDGIDDLHLVEVDGDTVRFRGSSGREHVAIAEPRLGPVVPASCGAAPEAQVAFTARVG
jgi:hypothetical protein